jgi:PKD repeat protein
MPNTVYYVSSSAELYSALAKATGGETILLAEGNYGGLGLSKYSPFDVTFASNVTIKSADADNPAVFTKLNMNEASNITLDGLVFDYTYKAGDDINMRPFQVNSSSNIVIKNSTFDGDVASGSTAVNNGYGFAQGLSVRASTDVTIQNNEFFDWHRGAVFENTKDLTITGNEISGIRSDGMNFAQVNNVLIEDNYIHDFRASPLAKDHRDMIQFWTTGTTKPSTDIVIRGNTLDIGDGNYTQSIFMGNEVVSAKLAGSEMFYQRVLIEDNAIYNAHLHGITVGQTNDLTIRSNSVIRAESSVTTEASTDSLWTPVINVKAASTDVTISNNATGRITIDGGQDTSAWILKSNVLIQDSDPTKPGYYGNEFVSSSLTALPDGSHVYIIRPGSLLEKLGAGAEQNAFDDAPADVMALFQTSGEHDTNRTVSFDGSLTVGADSVLVQDDARFYWDFGDGTTAEGLIVTHSYAKAGHYEVKLKVVDSDGDISIAQKSVGIVGADLVALNKTTGQFMAQKFGENNALSATKSALMAVTGGVAIDLGGTGVQAQVSKMHISPLLGADNFDLEMTLRAQVGAQPWGEVLRVHGSLQANVTQEGQLNLSLTTDDGRVHKLMTTGALLNDGKAHVIKIDFDGVAGKLQIIVDGRVAAASKVFGEVANSSSGLEFGNAWGKKNFEGLLLAFDLDVNRDDYPLGAKPTTTVVKQSPAEAVSAMAEPAADLAGVVSAATAPEAAPLDTPTDDETPELVHVPSGPVLELGYVLDLPAHMAKPGSLLMGDSKIVMQDGQPVLQLDGTGDYANVGRLLEYEDSDRIAFAVDFRRAEADGSTDRLIWNHLKLGLTLQGDGLSVQVAGADGSLKGFGIKDLGLNDTEMHRAVVLVDQTQDRLQVFVDDRLVLDETGTDFAFVDAGGREAGWMIGTPWSRYFEGDVADFRVTDKFDFADGQVPDTAPIV